MGAVREQRRDDLFDFLVANPDGVTVTDMMGEYGWSRKQATDAIRDLRHYLGAYDDINLPATPQGRGERWVYKLAGRLDDIRTWTGNRVGDAETRLRTIQSMLASIVAGTDGRTVEGRKARVIERALRHLIENLDDLELNGAPLP